MMRNGHIWKWLLMLAVSLAVGAFFCAGESGPGHEVVVLYNPEFEGSEDVARQYAELRQVPEGQVLALSVSTEEEISRAGFSETIEEPVASMLRDGGFMDLKPDEEYDYQSPVGRRENFRLAGEWTVRYLVLGPGFPLKIKNDPAIDQKEDGSRFFEGMRKNEAAVDNELAALPMRAITDLRTGIVENPNYGVDEGSKIHPGRGVLMVSRLDGPSVEIAGSLTPKAVQAEKSGLWGRVYIDIRNLKSGSYRLGDDWMKAAAQASRSYGLDVVMDENPGLFPSGFPMDNAIFYAGWYSTHPSGALEDGHIEFPDGAIAYHIHSFSASTVRSETSRWVGPLLASGATATMGCVYEPYLEFTPNIAIFWGKLLEGFSLGEAAYACMNSLSWQTVVVGDPLYRPFGVPLEERHQSNLESGGPELGWSILALNARRMALLEDPETPSDTLAALAAIPGYARALETSPALNEKVARLLPTGLETNKVLEHYQKAFLLSESNPERIRLALVYGNLQKLFGNPTSAIRAFQYLLESFDVLENREKVVDSLGQLTRLHGAPEDRIIFERLSKNTP